MKHEEEKRLVRKPKGGGLPDDIIREILVRLPTDSVLKCMVVCKSWNSLVKTRAFVVDHLNSQSNNTKNIKDDLLLSCSRFNVKEGKGAEFMLLDCDSFSDGYTKRRAIPLSDFIATICSVYGRQKEFQGTREWVPVGACNGLICMERLCCSKDRIRVKLIVLWNPCVRKFLVLPSPTDCSPLKYSIPVCDVGYDLLTHDFKVVHFVCPDIGDYETPHTFQVFSMKAGSWKNLNPPLEFRPFFYKTKSVEVNGALHWVCGKPYRQIDESTVVITFNLCTELFGRMKIPEALRKDPPYCYLYGLKYGESLGLFAWADRSVYDLWVMKEYGVAESWSKLLAFRTRDPGNPIYFRKSGETILVTSNEGVVSTDPQGNQVKVIADDGRHYISLLEPFVETLVLLDRSDAFSFSY